MGTPDEIHAALFDQPHIPVNSCMCHRICPSGVVLMDIGPQNVIMLSIQEKSLIWVKCGCPDAKFCKKAVLYFSIHQNFTDHLIQHRRFRRPRMNPLHFEALFHRLPVSSF